MVAEWMVNPARVFWERGKDGRGCALGKEDGDLVFVDREEEQGGGLAVGVGEVCAFEGGVGWEGCCIGEVEAEGEAALEPGFDGVAVGRDDLGVWLRWRGWRGAGREVRRRGCWFDGALRQPRSETASRMAAAIAAHVVGRME